jgi:hypothetical protein
VLNVAIVSSRRPVSRGLVLVGVGAGEPGQGVLQLEL